MLTRQWYFAFFAFTGCLPNYVRQGKLDVSPSSEKAASVGVVKNQTEGLRREVAALDPQTFRFQSDFKSVWDSALEILIRNYNLNLVNKSSGLITTEWDSYYIGSKLFRNKVTLRIKRTGWNAVDVIVYNNVESLRTNAANTSQWIPNKESATESHRIIQNMALFLDHVPPKVDLKISRQSGEK